MKKILLTTILWFISIAVFAQTEPTKYLIKYLETNTAQPDYGVSFLSDTEFIYKSPNTEDINTNSAKQSESNLFIATFNDNGDISEKRQIQGMPTDKVTKTGAAYSPDKKTVYFSAKKFRKKARRNDREQLFKADVNEDGKWINIEKLPFSNDSYSFGEPSLSADGLELYFTSDMPGTLGGADIFKVGINSNGNFGEPKNLGTTVNTSGNEVTPYITKNNTFYFSSDNHKGGLGNLDVYSLDINNPTAKPVHLDAPINSTNDDFAFVITSNGKRGYFSSNRLQGQNNHDIYSFLVDEVKEDGPCVQAIAGVVKDNITKEVVPNALITLYDDAHNELSKIETDADGKYSLTLDCNKTYTLTAGGNNYNTEDHIVNTANYLEAPTLEANKFLIKKSDEEIANNETFTDKNEVTEGVTDTEETFVANAEDVGDAVEEETIVQAGSNYNSTTAEEDESTVNPIYFGFDKSTVSAKSARELDKLSEILMNNKTIHVELSSYTDSRGSSAYNLRLSERRAQASKEYLVAKGIDRSRIKAKGYGESRMVNKCIDGIECSEAAHEKNRRTEFAFINSQASIESFDNNESKTITTNYEEKEEEVEEVTEAVETSNYSAIEETKTLIESNYEEVETNTTEIAAVPETTIESTDVNNNVEVEPTTISNNTLKNEEVRTASLTEPTTTEITSVPETNFESTQLNNDLEDETISVANNSINNKSDTSTSLTETNIGINNEEETLSDEAKWLNSQTEKNEVANSVESNNSSPINKEELSYNSVVNNQQNEQLIDPITDTSKSIEYDKLVTAANTEVKNEPKFNFENEQTNKQISNTDPNQLLADLKAKREAEQAKHPELVSTVQKVENEIAKSDIPTIKKEAILSTGEVSVRAMQSKRGKYVETDRSGKVNALRVTFRIQPNSHSEKGYKDAYVVIKSPGGKVINEKGVFPLMDGVDQAYTDQTTLYYNRQSIKAVMFIDKIVHKFSKGVYTVNIFIDGVDVGENIIRLS